MSKPQNYAIKYYCYSGVVDKNSALQAEECVFESHPKHGIFVFLKTFIGPEHLEYKFSLSLSLSFYPAYAMQRGLILFIQWHIYTSYGE